MTIPNLSAEQMRIALKELEQASYNHEQWAEALYGTLTFRLAPDERDLKDEAHRLCRFGQWLYQLSDAGHGRHPAFSEIESEHKRMHQYAASLLRASVEGAPISIEDFARFRATRERLRLEIASLKYEFQDALYNIDTLTGMPSRVGMLTKLPEQQQFVRRKAHRKRDRTTTYRCAFGVGWVSTIEEVDTRWRLRRTVLARSDGRGALMSASGLSMKLWRPGRLLRRLRVGTV